MTNRLINLLLLAMVFGLFACDSPVSEKPEQLGSSSLNVSSSGDSVSSSSEMNSPSSNLGSSSSSTTLKTEISHQIIMTQSCNLWEMKDLDTSYHKMSSWSGIPDLNRLSYMGCTSNDSIECSFGAVGSSMIMKYSTNKVFSLKVSLYPIKLNLVLDTGLSISDTIVQAKYNYNDSIYHFSLSPNSMQFSVETNGVKKSYFAKKDSDSSWSFKIGKLSGTGFRVNKTNEEGDTVMYSYSRYISDSTGRETILGESSLFDSRVNFLEVNDTLRYVYWYGYAAQARECSNWNGDQIRFH